MGGLTGFLLWGMWKDGARQRAPGLQCWENVKGVALDRRSQMVGFGVFRGLSAATIWTALCAECVPVFAFSKNLF